MSTVWLQVGQCGNQIAQELWHILGLVNGSCGKIDRNPFCSRDGKLSAVCVDSESKVIKKMQKQVKKGLFRESNLITGKQGRGKNWACGYYNKPLNCEESLLYKTMERLRKEVELRDCYSGTVIFHSLSGGTGAGLGSHLCEEIRDEYPLGQILSVTVAPYQTGECPLQHYNILLCLSWLQRFTDGIFLFYNDDVLKRTIASLGKKNIQESWGVSQVSLSSMNTYIADCVAGLLYPVSNFQTTSGLNMGVEPWELLRAVCPVPTMKFLHVAQTSTRGQVLWDSMVSSVTRFLAPESSTGKPHYSTSLLSVARSSHCSLIQPQSSAMKRLQRAYGCVSWNPFPLSLWTASCDMRDPTGQRHSLTVCANHSSIIGLLKHTLEKAQRMYSAKAYTHWYRQYGCEGKDFEQAFDTLSSVEAEYYSAGQ
ncbi:tubulin delta chain-like isoform X1 [Dromiciops gliroides]|uniref:tubulin delta chain-like isoform X1 n=2 Tax=Dromiciops gliroides TaxID=33562 RepID=UPI001CC3D8A6|nr:tubulin delta chain-like isoform X1 [Dromiciops gliroides]